MTDGLVEQKRSPVNKASAIDEYLTVRFPDYGPLNIPDFEKYKKSSKKIFYEKWAKPHIYFKKTESLSNYEQLKLVGSGTFGYVVLVRHESSKDNYALKCVRKRVVIKHGQVENLKTEKLLLLCINFPFTIYALHTFKDNSYIYFVLPFVEGGDLYGHLQFIGKGNEDKARFYASQVILALEYLHYLDFVYRDLKPENILLDHTGYLKLADFGFTKRLKKRLRTYTICGTPEYIAPEIVQLKGHGKPVDWWATGCFIYELVAGRTPFVAGNDERIYENIISRNYKCPKSFSVDLKELVDNMLQIDLSKRYGNLRNGVADIKNHKWLVSVNWMAILNRTIEAPYKPKHASLDLDRTSFTLPEDKVNTYAMEFADF